MLHCRECAKSFKGKQIEKGVAFPTCVSPNRWAAHTPDHRLWCDGVDTSLWGQLKCARLAAAGLLLATALHGAPGLCWLVLSFLARLLHFGAAAAAATTVIALCLCSIVGHFSPLADNPTTVKNGDLVKM